MVLRKKTKSPVLFIVLLSVLFAVLLAGGLFLFFRSAGTDRLIEKRFQVDQLDPNAISGRMPGTPKDEKSPGEGMFSYRINPAPMFQSDGSNGDIMVQNPAFNKYLMVLEITAEGIDGMVYQSQFIAPNQYISTIDLQKKIPSGTYQATAYLNAVDPTTLDLVDTMVCPMNLTVQS